MIQDAQTKGQVKSDKRIVYIIGTYPELTKTFIDREILEAKRAGLNVSVLAIRRARTGDFSAPVKHLMEEIVYLIPASAVHLVRAHSYYLVRHFRKYVKSLAYVVTRSHPTFSSRVKTCLHFGAGVVAADSLRRSGAVDHIHAHFADGAAVIAMVASRLLEVPYSLTAHAFDIYRSPVFLKDKVGNAKFVTTCTAFNKAYLEKETGHPVELIYHGLDFAAIREVGAASEKPVPSLILSVGRLQEKKGFAYLIEACALLKGRGCKFRCEIVGDGPDRAALSSLIRKLGLVDQVSLCGALPNSEVLVRYSKASVFVLPCCVTEDGDRDGIPNVILEAMAFGLPVISTNVSGIPEVIRNWETGLLVESRCAESLSVAIAQLIERPMDAASLGQNALEFVEREFDIRRNVGRMMQLLSD